MNGYNNRQRAGSRSGGARKSSRSGGGKPTRMGRGPGRGSPGGFGTSRRGRKFKSRSGDNRRFNGGGRGGNSAYQDGFEAGVAHAQRIGYRF